VALAEGRLEAGDEEGAFSTAALLPAASGKPWNTWSIWGKAAVVRARAADVTGALQILARMEADHARRVRSGELQAALRPGESFDIEDMKEGLLREVALARAEAGDLPAAREVARRIPPDSYTSRSTWRFIGRAEAGRDQQQARRTVKALPPAEGALVLQAVADAQARAGDPKAARATLQEALDLALHHVDSLEVGATAAEALFLIAEALAKAGDMDAARKTADAIPDRNAYLQSSELWDTPFQWMFHRNTALVLIARAQSRRGDVGGALKTLCDIQAEDDVAKRYAETLRAYAALEIARAKVRTRGGKEALAWAKGRPSEMERSWAIQGVAAEALRQRAPARK
jgi:hypothetical protein